MVGRRVGRGGAIQEGNGTCKGCHGEAFLGWTVITVTKCLP